LPRRLWCSFALSLAIAASASHLEVSLPGSHFEIGTNAGLNVADTAPSIDWASVTETQGGPRLRPG
jgi:hypothetical protein